MAATFIATSALKKHLLTYRASERGKKILDIISLIRRALKLFAPKPPNAIAAASISLPTCSDAISPPNLPVNQIVLESFPNLPNTVGPFQLTKEMIAKIIPPFNPGHFAVGAIHESGGLIPEQIGRSDVDLSSKLEEVIGSATHFMAHIDLNLQSAFRAECILYHLFGKALGLSHPMRNFEQRWDCPKCGIFNPGP